MGPEALKAGQFTNAYAHAHASTHARTHHARTHAHTQPAAAIRHVCKRSYNEDVDVQKAEYMP